MASPVQFILLTQMCKYFLYHYAILIFKNLLIHWLLGRFYRKMAQLTMVSPKDTDIRGTPNI